MKVKKGKKEALALIRNIIRIVREFWIMNPGMVLIYLGVMMVIATLPFGVSYLNGQVINKVVIFLSDESVSKVVIYKLLVLALLGGLIERLMYKLSDWANRMSYFEWNSRVPVDVARAISGLDLAKLEDSEFRTKLAKVEDGSGHRAGNFINTIFWLINDFVQVVVAMVILFSLAVWVTPVILITLMPQFWILLAGSKATWGIWDAKEAVKKRYWEARSKLTNETSLQEIRIFGLRSYLLNMMSSLLGEFLGEQKKIYNKENKLTSLTSVLENVVYGLIEFWVLLQVLARKLGIGDYNFYLSSINRFVSASRNLLRNINKLYEDNLYLTDYFDLMDIL